MKKMLYTQKTSELIDEIAQLRYRILKSAISDGLIQNFLRIQERETRCIVIKDNAAFSLDNGRVHNITELQPSGDYPKDLEALAQKIWAQIAETIKAKRGKVFKIISKESARWIWFVHSVEWQEAITEEEVNFILTRLYEIYFAHIKDGKFMQFNTIRLEITGGYDDDDNQYDALLITISNIGEIHILLTEGIIQTVGQLDT